MIVLAIDPGNIESAYVNKLNYKVYKHTTPNGKVYIGMTALELSDRWRAGKGYKNSLYFNRAIKKHGWENIKHEVIRDCLTKEQAEHLEIELIKQHRSNIKEYGYNIESGGKAGAIGVKRRKETLEKMRAANLGKTMPDKTRMKISETLKRRVFTEEHKRKLSLAQMGERNHMYGKKVPPDVRAKMSASQPKGKDSRYSRKVAQIDSDTNEIIKIWDSMGDVRRGLGIKHCTISDCCRGIQKTSGGYKWRYYDEQR